MPTPQIPLDKWQRRVLQHLWQDGPASRLALAELIDLSPAAMTKIIRGLIALGIVEEMDMVRDPGRGRPSVPLRIAPGSGYAIGATPHHGAIEIVLINFLGESIGTVRRPFDDPSPDAFAVTLRRYVHDLVEEHRLLGMRLLGVGLGVPGPSMAEAEERWHTVESLAGWRDVALRRTMAERLALPIWVENDANATAMAEFYLGGVVRRSRSAVVLLLGHGIGAGIIDHGRLVRGQIGNAGDIGLFYPIDCPRPSTLDLLDTLRTAGCPIRSAMDVEPLLQSHAGVIDQWIERAALQLVPLVKGAVAWLDPGEIVISGPLPHGLLDRLSARLSEAQSPSPAGRLAITPSRLGGSATVLGAALLPVMASVGMADMHMRQSRRDQSVKGMT